MKIISLYVASMLLLNGIVQATVPTMPAPPVSSVVTSQGRAVYVMLKCWTYIGTV